MKYIFIILIIIACSDFCKAQRAFTEDQLKREFPKKEQKYKLSKECYVLKDSSVISTNAVYVNIIEESLIENYKNVKTVNSYRYMRFFPDGRVFISFAYLSYPNKEEFNDLTYGKYGRYIIEDGKIIIEFYMNRQYGIMFMFAKPLYNDIQFYATSYRRHALIKNRSREGGFYQKNYTALENSSK